jgi:hypothetical protein
MVFNLFCFSCIERLSLADNSRPMYHKARWNADALSTAEGKARPETTNTSCLVALFS